MAEFSGTLVKQAKNKKMPTTGFHTNPERINRAGRPPKGHAITDVIREMMEATPDIKRELAQKILELAMGGDIAALKLLWNYLEGMPRQTIGIDDEREREQIDAVSLLITRFEMYERESSTSDSKRLPENFQNERGASGSGDVGGSEENSTSDTS